MEGLTDRDTVSIVVVVAGSRRILRLLTVTLEAVSPDAQLGVGKGEAGVSTPILSLVSIVSLQEANLGTSWPIARAQKHQSTCSLAIRRLDEWTSQVSHSIAEYRRSKWSSQPTCVSALESLSN